MANGLTRPLNIEARAPKRKNIIEDIFGTPAERIQQRQLEAAQELQQERRVQKQKESDYRLFMQFERNFENLSDKRSLADQMGLDELVAGMDNKYDFGTIQSEEQLLQDMTKAADARELVQIYSNIRDDSYYSDKALKVAESRMKEFGNIIPAEQRTDYDLNKADYYDGVQAIQRYEQEIANTKEPFTNPQINIGSQNNPIPISYNDLVKLNNDEKAKQVLRLKAIEAYENNFNNQFQYALSQFGPQPEVGEGEERNEAVDNVVDVNTADNIEEINNVITERNLTDIDDLGLDEQYVKTLENLDISAIDADVLGDDPSQIMEPIVSSLENIQSFLTADVESGAYFTSENIGTFRDEVKNLSKELFDLGVNVSDNEVVRLLNTADFGGTPSYDIIFGGPDAINDAERRKIEKKVERTRKRIEKSQRGEGLNPKVLDMFGTEDKLERLINELDSPQKFTSEDLLRMLSEG